MCKRGSVGATGGELTRIVVGGDDEELPVDGETSDEAGVEGW